MKIFTILQVVSAILLMVLILLQNRGVGLSGIFGGSSNIYQTKRGLEKNLFVATIVIAAAFFLISLASVIMV
ncbi:MAG: preprotein translocase subunit SecG [Planctomycetes bacterium]|jgi:protein translocase SecG subunit|nr:preprotein translocase subunit SecG [Planctomycetota bacterium]